MNTTINVNITKEDPQSYPIYIEQTDIELLASKIKEETSNHKRLFVIDEKVYKIYKSKFSFNKNEVFILKSGEQEKNIKNYIKIIKKAYSLNLTRSDAIIAIGGGVVGDLTGFVAATYMRGIKYIQVPTTLLAFVDSSVGGKTAIDLPKAKNYIGAFYQPKAVYINLNFLKTLDKKQIRSGFGEVIKYAFIENSFNDGENNSLLLEFLTVNASKIKNLDLDFIEKVIKICLNIKISIVSKDEKESGLRKILNLGHTFAHALEEITNYDKYPHGIAVAYGLMFIFNYALQNKLIDDTYYRLAFNLLDKYGFSPLKKHYSKEDLITLMNNDKKNSDGYINLVVPTGKRTVEVQKIKDLKSINFETEFLLD